MTNRATKRLQDILIEVSARKGAYIATLINLKISSSTALRLVEQMPLPIIESVNVLGIDDWAIRKGTTYGTILVDNETQRVIGVLKGRDGSLLKDWLKDHPEVKVVTRDRASSFSKAVIDVLPDCVQVADRFHLYKNMSDCAYEVIKSEYKNLSNSLCQQDKPQEYKTEVQICTTDTENMGTKSHYGNRFDKVKEMLTEGYSIRNIARLLNMSRNSIRKYINMEKYPSKSITGRNNYIQYQQHIINEITKGSTIKKTFETLSQQGFGGSLSSFYVYMKRTSSIKIQDYKPVKLLKYRMLSPRKIATFLKYADLAEIPDRQERQTMIELLKNSKILSQLRRQMLQFKQILVNRDITLLDDWIKETLNLGMPQLRTFIRGLKMDFEAVKNAILLKWSNGQVEGHVNRLKSIKRQMYGRAGFELLRKKVMLSKVG